MTGTDKVFDGFLRMLIARMKKALKEKDDQKVRELLKEILNDLEDTLED